VARSRSRSSEQVTLSEPTRVVVGRVRSAHGLRGLVRVEVLTDRPEERFAVGQVLHPEGSGDALTIEFSDAVADGPGWRLGFEEIHDRAVAERLRSVYLEVPVDRDAELEPGQAFWHEVIGAAVHGTDGRLLGTVAEVYRAGEAEVYVVRGGPIGEFDLPSVRSIVTTFDPRGAGLVIDEAALNLDEPATAQRSDAKRRNHPWSRHGKGKPNPKSADGVAEAVPDAGSEPDQS
jgi:16S rRNA processing protein RimM